MFLCAHLFEPLSPHAAAFLHGTPLPPGPRWLAARCLLALLRLLGWLAPATPLAVRAVLAADQRPADDLAPTVADLRAHAVLTAAPPRSRAPILAGAA